MVLQTQDYKGKYDVPQELLSHIPGYITRREEEIVEMKAALVKKDFDVIHKIGHKLKGNGAGFGFPRLSLLGSEIMDACSESSLDRVKTLIDNVVEEVSNIRKEILSK